MTANAPSLKTAMRLARDLGASHPVGSESVPIGDAIGRTLAADVFALCSVPGFCTSAMDGWAVSGSPPWLLGDPIRAGDQPDTAPLLPGHARPIATGAPIPPNAIAVLRHELGITHLRPGLPLSDEWLTVQSEDDGACRPGKHIRLIGEEAVLAERVLDAGMILSPPRTALAASCGHDELTVRLRPHVDLLVTGNEVVRAGIPAPGQIRDSFGPQLPWLVHQLGGAIGRTTYLDDDLLSIVDRVRDSRAHIVLLTGGSSHGPSDRFRDALTHLGSDVTINGVGMRPGHPLILAELRDGKMIVGLPGNPLAGVMGCLTIVSSLLSGVLGHGAHELRTVRTGVSVPNSHAECELVPYTLQSGGAVPTKWHGSAMMRGLAQADGVLIVPSKGATVNENVETLDLPWRRE